MQISCLTYQQSGTNFSNSGLNSFYSTETINSPDNSVEKLANIVGDILRITFDYFWASIPTFNILPIVSADDVCNIDDQRYASIDRYHLGITAIDDKLIEKPKIEKLENLNIFTPSLRDWITETYDIYGNTNSLDDADTIVCLDNHAQGIFYDECIQISNILAAKNPGTLYRFFNEGTGKENIDTESGCITFTEWMPNFETCVSKTSDSQWGYHNEEILELIDSRSSLAPEIISLLDTQRLSSIDSTVDHLSCVEKQKTPGSKSVICIGSAHYFAENTIDTALSNQKYIILSPKGRGGISSKNDQILRQFYLKLLYTQEKKRQYENIVATAEKASRDIQDIDIEIKKAEALINLGKIELALEIGLKLKKTTANDIDVFELLARSYFALASKIKDYNSCLKTLNIASKYVDKALSLSVILPSSVYDRVQKEQRRRLLTRQSAILNISKFIKTGLSN
jgi:hypothetical protein